MNLIGETSESPVIVVRRKADLESPIVLRRHQLNRLLCRRAAASQMRGEHLCNNKWPTLRYCCSETSQNSRLKTLHVYFDKTRHYGGDDAVPLRDFNIDRVGFVFGILQYAET